MDTGAPVSPEQYVKLLKALAEQGSGKAQHNLGALFLEGRGVERDVGEALKWFRQAALRGVALSQHNLGALYLKGEVVARDAAEAGKWFRMAAEQGDPRSQHSLGAMLFEGLGVEKDPVASYFWLSLAVEGAPEALREGMAAARDEVAEHLDDDQLREARELVLERGQFWGGGVGPEVADGMASTDLEGDGEEA